MGKVELISQDPHYPLGSVVRVNEKDAPARIASGKYSKPSETTPEAKSYPDDSWTEKEILAWIERNNYPVKYDIKRDTKKEALQRLREAGLLG